LFEVSKPGWALTDISCSFTEGEGIFSFGVVPGPTHGGDFQHGDNGIYFELGPEQGPGSTILQCTFTNSEICTNPQQVIVSDATVQVFDREVLAPGAAGPASPWFGVPAGWNTSTTPSWPLAVQTTNQPGLWLDPNSTNAFAQTDARWISVSANAKGPDYNSSDIVQNVYLYRVGFTLPAGASNIKASAAIAADNYGWLYVNGIEALAPASERMSFSSVDSSNFLHSNRSIGAIPHSALNPGANVLAAEVHNWTSMGAPHLETGVIFSLEICYDLPVGGSVGLTVSTSGVPIPWEPLAMVAAVMTALAASLWFGRRRLLR
jgi:hypothetical protein